MIKLIFNRYFQTCACLVSSIIEHFPRPNSRTSKIIAKFYKGPASKFRDEISKGSQDGPLFINTVKMYHEKDYKTFSVLGRILSGTLKEGQKVRILGEDYDRDDQEDMFVKTVQKINLFQGRYKIEVK